MNHEPRSMKANAYYHWVQKDRFSRPRHPRKRKESGTRCTNRGGNHNYPRFAPTSDKLVALIESRLAAK